MSNTSRNLIRKTLSSKFDGNESKKIESKIFAWSQLVLESFIGKYGPIFTINEIYKGLAYEKLGELLLHPDKKDYILKETIDKGVCNSPVYNLINKDKLEASTVINVIGWNGYVYLDYRDSEKKDMMGGESAMKVKKGEFKCKVKTCRSDECYHFTMQTRSCDEGGTTYVVCTKCRGMYTIH